MSGNRKTAGKTATSNGGARCAAANKTSDGIEAVIRQCDADGVTWTTANTGPCQKTFKVELTLDLSDRVKLGLCAADANETPEALLRCWLWCAFEEKTAALIDKDKARYRDFIVLYMHALGGVVKAEGSARLAFAPAALA